MSNEFYFESHISAKQLNHQSVSLVIPRLSRDKIHNNIYYKVNLSLPSLRCDTFMGLLEVIIRDFGTLKGKSINQVNMVGGIVFKCILMRLVEIKPTIEQLNYVLNEFSDHNQFDNKYIIALLLTYIRIQYYYISEGEEIASQFKNLFKKYINDYRKLKTLDMNLDCMTMSQSLNASIVHMDELVDWLVTKDEIWGIPLGRCTWCNIFEMDDDDESESSSDESSSE